MFRALPLPVLTEHRSRFGYINVPFRGIHGARAGQSVDEYRQTSKHGDDAGAVRQDRGGTRRIWQVRFVLGSGSIFRCVIRSLSFSGVDLAGILARIAYLIGWLNGAAVKYGGKQVRCVYPR